MKYRTFRTLMIGGGLLLVLGAFGSCLLCSGLGAWHGSSTPQATASPTPAMTPAAAPVAQTAAQPPVQPGADSLPVTDAHREILAATGRSISGDKVKDALPGRAFKVNLYKDPGETKVNRLKIDLDRDDKWDEKWTLEKSGAVKRQIAPADDESYTLEYRLEGDRWRKK